MKALALDPSSSVTGYAVGTGRLILAEAGRLTPRKTDASPLARIRTMKSQVRALLLEHHPDAVVIEVPNGKVNYGNRGGGAGLPIYGMAVGVILDVVWEYEAWKRGKGRAPTLCTPDQNLWTRGSKKEHRKLCARSDFPGRYFPQDDLGGDVADAICLMQWFFTHHAATESAA